MGSELLVGLGTFACIVCRGYKRTAVVYVVYIRAWSWRACLCAIWRTQATVRIRNISFGAWIWHKGEDWLWGWIFNIGTWYVVTIYCTDEDIFSGNLYGKLVWHLCTKERAAIRSVFDFGLYDRGVDMKIKGRYVLEATILIPIICILLVYLVFFTFYAHDYAVATQVALEAGIKGLYPDGSLDNQKKEKIEKDLKAKLSACFLWIQEEEITVELNPVRLKIDISGRGDFLPVDGIQLRREVYRIQPCKTIRRCRWMEEKDGNTI